MVYYFFNFVNWIALALRLKSEKDKILNTHTCWAGVYIFTKYYSYEFLNEQNHDDNNRFFTNK